MKTNPRLVGNAGGSNKKTDVSRRKFRLFNRTVRTMMNLEWFFRFTAFFLIITIPHVICKCFFYDDELSMWNGALVYGSFLIIMFIMTKQQHRMSHISGLENPFFLGYFCAFFVHNYYIYYADFMSQSTLDGPYHSFSYLLTSIHFYAFYKIMTTDPGTVRENLRKEDGTPYELHDLMKFKSKDGKSMNSRNSLNWLLRPSSGTVDKEKDELLSQAYFCEACCLIEAAPSKHCKLCEHCCYKFDHHCIYVNRCIGLKNHKYFIMFTWTTLLNTLIFIGNIYLYLHRFYTELSIKHLEQPIEDRASFLYYMFASSYHVWLITLIIMNGLPMIMVAVLLIMQLRVISLGYTSQYPAPYGFQNVSKRMQTFKSSLFHRLNNLMIFFCKSPQANLDLYHRQQREYAESMPPMGAPLPLGYYPRNEPATDLLMNDLNFSNLLPNVAAASASSGPALAATDGKFELNFDENKQLTTSKSIRSSETNNFAKQFEIELD